MEWTWLTFPADRRAGEPGAPTCWPVGSRATSFGCIRSIWSTWTRRRAECAGTTWLNVFSPRMESFNLTVPSRGRRRDRLATCPTTRPACGWPGWGCRAAALGGMNPRASGPLLWTEQFRYAPDLGRPAGRAHPGLVHQEPHGPLERRPHGLPRGRSDRGRSTPLRHDHQHAPLPAANAFWSHGGSVYEIGTLGRRRVGPLGPMAGGAS